jgi:hypothetical protein
MLPHAGCDRQMLEAVAEVADLLGVQQAAAPPAQQIEAMYAEVGEQVADAMERTNKIMWLEKSRRRDLTNWLRSGAWME